MTNSGNEIDDLRRRIQKLEDTAAPKSAWERFGSFLKMVIVPLTVVGSVVALYDQVYLSWKEEKANQATTAQSKLRALEDINTEIYSLNAPGSEERVQAILQAKAGRRHRLINEAFAFWQERPSEFNRFEKQMLANELLSINQTKQAIDLVDDLADEYITPLEQVQLALFEGRVRGGGETPQDITGAREAFKRAYLKANEFNIAKKEELWAQISYAKLFMELGHNLGCKDAALPAEMLTELTTRAEFPVDMGVLRDLTSLLLQTYRLRCEADS